MTVNGANTIEGPGLAEVDAAVRAVLSDRFASAGTYASKRQEIGTDIFAGRLLSLSQAEALVSGTKAVKVAPGTVITPLARDYLKHRGITVQFVAKGEVERTRNLGEWGFAIDSHSGVIEAFRLGLLSENEDWHEVGTTLEHAITWLTENDRRGVMHLTDEASVAVFRGCQSPTVRAALAYDVESASRAVRRLGVNLLVVEPSGKSIAALRQLALTFRRAGGPVAPDWLMRGPRP